MNLPPNIKLWHSGLINTYATQVSLDGNHIGEFEFKWGRGYRFRNSNGAWGDCATEWMAITELIELSKVTNTAKSV